jgi:hypothetical protein
LLHATTHEVCQRASVCVLLRAALMRLEQEGLLEALPSGGYAIKTFSERDVSEAIELQVARHLRARIRKEDTAGRVGLGSFALSLPGGVAVGIEGLIERLRGGK